MKCYDPKVLLQLFYLIIRITVTLIWTYFAPAVGGISVAISKQQTENQSVTEFTINIIIQRGIILLD